jgi:hypothetical protein
VLGFACDGASVAADALAMVYDEAVVHPMCGMGSNLTAEIL